MTPGSSSAWRAIGRHPAAVGLTLGAAVFAILFALPPGHEARPAKAPALPGKPATVGIPAEASASSTLIVAADDVVQVFVDGRLAVRSDTWAAPARVALPSGGKRVLIAAEARNERGPGGLIGAWRSPEGVTVPADWTCGETDESGWNQPTFDPKWERARLLSPYGGAPWGRPAGDELDGASWWWTRSPAGESQTIYCRWWIPARPAPRH